MPINHPSASRIPLTKSIRGFCLRKSSRGRHGPGKQVSETSKKRKAFAPFLKFLPPSATGASHGRFFGLHFRWGEAVHALLTGFPCYKYYLFLVVILGGIHAVSECIYASTRGNNLPGSRPRSF